MKQYERRAAVLVRTNAKLESAVPGGARCS